MCASSSRPANHATSSRSSSSKVLRNSSGFAFSASKRIALKDAASSDLKRRIVASALTDELSYEIIFAAFLKRDVSEITRLLPQEMTKPKCRHARRIPELGADRPCQQPAGHSRPRPTTDSKDVQPLRCDGRRLKDRCSADLARDLDTWAFDTPPYQPADDQRCRDSQDPAPCSKGVNKHL